MPEDAEIIIDVDVDSNKLDDNLQKILDKISSKKVELHLETKELKILNMQLEKLDNHIKDLAVPDDRLIKAFESVRHETEKSIQKIFLLRQNINLLSSEFRKLLKLNLQFQAYKQMMDGLSPSRQVSGLLPANIQKFPDSTIKPIILPATIDQLRNANVELKKLSDSSSTIKPIISPATTNQLKNANVELKKLSDSSSGLDNLKSNISSASNHVDIFSRRIFNLLRNAFIFNILSKGFRKLSELLGNLLIRDSLFAKSLMIVKANLVRAFAPIWQVVLPWIRLLGDALVWLSKIFIKFINFLTGSNIKPVETFKEAKMVVGDFYKIVSPKKDMFDVRKTKKLKDNIKAASKESNKLLASFDKLETLKFDKDNLSKDPFGLEELKVPKINDKSVGESLIGDQIDNAIKNIQDKPLDFVVNDNIGEQITSQVNGLELGTLDFKINETSQENLNSFKEKIRPLLEGISEMAKKTGESFMDLFSDIANSEASKKAKDFLDNLFDGMSENIKNFSKYEHIGTIIRDVIIGIGTAFAAYQIIANFGNLILLLQNIFAIFTDIGVLFSPAGLIAIAVGVLALIIIHWKDIKKLAVEAWESIRSFGSYLSGKFSETWNIIKESAKRAFDGIMGFVGKVGDFITNNIVNPIKSAFGFGHSGYSTSSIKIPHLAQGSVLKGGDPFLSWVNDQPRGQTNVEAPLDTIVSAFKQALSESEFNNQPEININASGDMSGLVRMLNFKLQDNKELSGNAFIDNIY